MSFNKETGMYEGYIYLIENKLNKHKYIGQTSQTIKKRWIQHKSDAKIFNYPLYRAINKYGEKNFTIYELEKITSKDKRHLLNQLNDKEIFWIDYYDTYNDGYNQTIGGQNNAPNKFPEHAVIEYTLHGEYIFTYKTVTDASDATGFSASDISSCCSKVKINRVQNRIFRYKENPLTQKEVDYFINRYPIISQYDFEGHLINKFDFATEAAKSLGLSYKMSGNIANVCKGKYKFAYGYIWRYNNDSFDKYQLPKSYIIEQRELDGTLVNKYNSFIEAAKETKSKANCINKCCNGFSKFHNNYIWCYEGEYNSNIKIKLKDKPIKQYDIKGNLLRKFTSIQDAADFYNINRNTIGEVCRGEKPFANGYVWRFEEDDFTKYKIDINKMQGYRKINQYTKDNIFIRTYNNSSEAKSSINITSTSSIIACCKNKLKSAYGYRWYYANDISQPDKTKITA